MKRFSGPATIGEAARLVDKHPATLRRLERRGFLLPKRTWSGRRVYGAADIRKLRELFGLDDPHETP